MELSSILGVIGIVLFVLVGLVAILVVIRSTPEDKHGPVIGTLYAKEGEIVTCLNGHEICELAKDIFVADMISVNQFKNWRHQPQPVPHDPITPCMVCGAPYVTSTTAYGGTRLHINGEWRTTRHDG